MKHNQLNRVLQGTLLLSLSSLIAKILSAVYRVPFQNLVGNDGFYVYQQVYPIYGLGVVLALSGLPVFISKLIAEQDDELQQVAIARQLWRMLLVIALVVVAFLWGWAPQIALAMGDRRLTPVIRSVSWMFLGMPFLSVGRGYHQGQYLTWPTSITQVIEQVIRVSIVVLVAVMSLHNSWNIYEIGTYAMASAPVAAAVATLIIILASSSLIKASHVPKSLVSNKLLLKRLLVEGGALCLFSSMMILLQLVDSFTVKSALVDSGVSSMDAMQLKGIFDRGQPLIQLGLVMATSISALLVPSLTESYLKGQMVEFRRQFQLLLHVCVAISALCTIGLIALMPQINQLLFSNQQGSLTLAVNMVSILLASQITTYSSVMQSLNRFSQIVIGLVAGLMVKVVTNYVLVIHFDILGASLGTVLALLVTLLIVWRAVPAYLHWNPGSKFNIKLTAVCVIMGFSAWTVGKLMTVLVGPGRLASILVVGISVVAGIIIALVLSIKVKLLSAKEMLLLPHGKELLKKLRQ